jgi:hypothetical protein
LGVATLLGASESSLSLGQLAASAEKNAEAKCGGRAAASVRAAIGLLCASRVAGSLESNAEL